MTALSYFDGKLRPIVRAHNRYVLDHADYLKAVLYDPTKDHVFIIQPLCSITGDEKLASICIGSGISLIGINISSISSDQIKLSKTYHTQQPRFCVLEGEVLICKFVAINTHAPRSIALR